MGSIPGRSEFFFLEFLKAFTPEWITPLFTGLILFSSLFFEKCAKSNFIMVSSRGLRCKQMCKKCRCKKGAKFVQIYFAQFLHNFLHIFCTFLHIFLHILLHIFGKAPIWLFSGGIWRLLMKKTPKCVKNVQKKNV